MNKRSTIITYQKSNHLGVKVMSRHDWKFQDKNDPKKSTKWSKSQDFKSNCRNLLCAIGVIDVNKHEFAKRSGKLNKLMNLSNSSSFSSRKKMKSEFAKNPKKRKLKTPPKIMIFTQPNLSYIESTKKFLKTQ